MVSCLALCPILAVTGDSPSGKRDAKFKKKLYAEKIVDEWLSKVNGGGGITCSFKPTPNTSKFHAASFSTNATMEKLWNFYAQKCGMDKKYNPKMRTNGGDEKGKFGPWFLQELPGGDRDSLFVLHTTEYTVSATLHAAPGKQVSGTVVVVLH
jgi:hypothetical protein